MHAFYPRKQTVVIFILCIVVVVLVTWYAKPDWKIGEINYKGQNAIESGKYDPVIADDNTSWKDQFISSSTGTINFKSASSDSTAKNEPLTLTDQLGRDFFAKFMLMQQGGIVNDPTKIQEVTNQLISDSITNAPYPETISINKIKVNNNIITSQMLKNYGDMVIKILNNNMPKQNEAEIADRALSEDDMEILKEIDTNISGYQSALSAMLNTPVPKPLSEYHLGLVNGVNIQLFNSKALRRLDTDPVLALNAINYEILGLQKINDSLASIKQYFITAGIPFGW
ncbi:MAG: hypothetical protein WCW03_01400 [Candidatus Paceibacterota bacterium]|jgi:hypothetical protein